MLEPDAENAVAADGQAPVAPLVLSPPSTNGFDGDSGTGESDALRILFQASAAAESLQQRFSELQQRRSELQAEQRQLEADRQAFEAQAREFASQVARDRTEHRELTADLTERLAAVSRQEDQLQRQAGELRAAQRALAEERVILKQSVRSELDEERMKLSQDRAILDAERARLREQAERERQEFAERVRVLDEETRTERLRLADKARQELATEVAQLHQRRQEWQQTLETQLAELQRQLEDLQQQRELFGQQVEAEQARQQDELEKKRQALLTEQSNLQRRYRFQFEHLTRAREDHERELREFRREQQLFRSERLGFMEQHRLRFRQLERIRLLLMDREASLERELTIVERTRMAGLSDVQRLRLRFEEERDAITRDLDSRASRIRQQETSLAELTARLEERSQRLTRLRAELDQTQAEILEQRLVVEETQAGLLSSGSSSESLRVRMEQARRDVQAHFDRLRTQVVAERDKVEEAAAELTQRQQQFRRDRAELEQWFLSREEELAGRSEGNVAEELRAEIQQLVESRELAHAEHLKERRESERVLRELLEQLAIREMRLVATPDSDEPQPMRGAAA